MSVGLKAFALARDSQSRPIGYAYYSIGKKLTVAASSNRTAIPTGAEIVALSTTGACYIKFGSSSVVAAATDTTGHDCALLAGEVRGVVIPPGATHVAAIRVSDDGTLFISKVN